jgi:hypothetical protein
VDVFEDEILAGGPFTSSDYNDIAGKALFFSANGVDCDADGTQDSCETDCNYNTVADDCDLLAGVENDCDVNGALDICQHDFEYRLETHNGSGAWGPGVVSLEFVWLNHFFVQPGGQTLSHVAVAWLAYGPHRLPGEIVIYDDTNNDGHPADAVLLGTHPVEILTDIGMTGIEHTAYRITPTYVGEPGESFFVGVHMTLPAQAFVAVADNSPTPGHSNWHVSALPGTDFSSLAGWTINPLNGDWHVRAAAFDCNGNGTWDQCDIANGVSIDLNGNGVPDECEQPRCAADIAENDGVVNIDDLLAVISAWGPCPAPPAACPANIASGGASANAVDIDDLLAVISAWGPCR